MTEEKRQHFITATINVQPDPLWQVSLTLSSTLFFYANEKLKIGENIHREEANEREWSYRFDCPLFCLSDP